MIPFSEEELAIPLTLREQARQDEIVRLRAQEGLDSGRLRRVESPCVAETLKKRFASIWLYMRTHMRVWIVALLLIVGVYVSFTL